MDAVSFCTKLQNKAGIIMDGFKNLIGGPTAQALMNLQLLIAMDKRQIHH